MPRSGPRQGAHPFQETRMRKNSRPLNDRRTFEGAKAAPMSELSELQRTVSSCFLWENQFYEDGVSIANRIAGLCRDLPNDKVLDLALRLRKVDGLRHAPLMMAAACAAKRGSDPIVSRMIGKIISRPDEAGELMMLIAEIEGRDSSDLGKRTPSCARRGIAKAMRKFDAYQMAKYDRAATVRLRDVLRISHPVPKDEGQSDMWARLISGELASPDTWEVALSSGEGKREAFTRLLESGKMPYLALLRNLRNMEESGVDRSIIKDAILARRGARMVLPFRYIAAARACPSMEPFLDEAMQEAVRHLPMLRGETIVLVDVSGSMSAPLSSRSDMKRIDAAAGLAVLVNAPSARVFSFSNELREVPRRAGMGGVDAIRNSQPNRSTRLGMAMTVINEIPHDRVIVITDEQSSDRVPDPVAERAYMINVASHDRSVNFGSWTSISGFSENVFRFIEAHEAALGAEVDVIRPVDEEDLDNGSPMAGLPY